MDERPKVVVGIDGSVGSRAALLFALEEAAHRGTGVRVVSVLLPPPYWPSAYGLAAPPTIAQVKDDLRVIARRTVDGLVAERPDLAAVPVELHEVEGQPAGVLIAQARGADLLVVGHRGRGGVASAVLGFVGLQCVLHAECPVAVIPPAPQPAVDTPETNHAERHAVAGGVGYGFTGPLY